MADFEWTQPAIDAAQMVAVGELSYEAIARAVNCAPNTLLKWRGFKEFQERVESIREDRRQHVRRRGIAVLENRVASLNARHELMMQVIQDRAADPRMAEIPGGRTGLMVITGYRWPPRVKQDGPRPLDDQGDEDEGSPVVAIVEVDTALLKELREHEKQAAQELGQWADKKELTGTNGGPVEVTATVRLMAAKELEEWRKEMMPALTGQSSTPSA